MTSDTLEPSKQTSGQKEHPGTASLSTAEGVRLFISCVLKTSFDINLVGVMSLAD